MGDFTIRNLDEIDDSAAGHGLGDLLEARFAGAALGAQATGLALHRIRPGRRQPFGHRHEEAEEVYVVVSGSGRVRLDDEVRELRRLDAVRVAPSVMRCFEAGDEGLELLAFGPRHEGDAVMDREFWPAG